MHETITVDHVIELLNELIAIDSGAVSALMQYRVTCNEELVDHPTVQALNDKIGYSISALGLINGMFGVDERGYGPITWVTQNGRAVRFQRTPKSEQ